MPKTKAAAPAPTGFQIRPRYREVTCDLFELEDGEVPFTATIRTNLTFAQLEEIPSGDDATFPEVWEVIHPYVIAWNLMAEDASTGEIVDVPPPAEAGPDIAKMLEPQISYWLITQVRTAHLGGVTKNNEIGEDRKNGSTPGPVGAKNSAKRA